MLQFMVVYYKLPPSFRIFFGHGSDVFASSRLEELSQKVCRISGSELSLAQFVKANVFE